MGIRFACPNGHRLNVKSFLAGKRGICPHCNARFTIPNQSVPGLAKKRTPVDNADIPTSHTTTPQASVVDDIPSAVPVSDSPPLDPIPATAPAPAQSSGVTKDSAVAESVAESSQRADQITLESDQDDSSDAPAHTENRAAAQSDAQPSESIPSGLTGTDSTSPEPAEWFVQIADGQRFGPADWATMKAWVLEGRVAPDNLVHQRGWPTWRTAVDVFPELHQSPTAPKTDATADLVVDGSSRTDRFRGRQAAKSRLFAIVATLGITSVVLLAALIYVVRR